jgi:hypothetical protein
MPVQRLKVLFSDLGLGISCGLINGRFPVYRVLVLTAINATSTPITATLSRADDNFKLLFFQRNWRFTFCEFTLDNVPRLDKIMDAVFRVFCVCD